MNTEAKVRIKKLRRKNTVPRAEIVRPEAFFLLEFLQSNVHRKEQTGPLFTKSDRLNIRGRQIVEEIYPKCVDLAGGNYQTMLDLCRDALSISKGTGIESESAAITAILRSVRGKIVYQAHKTWVEEQTETSLAKKEASATRLAAQAKQLKTKKPETQIYQEATRLEKEKSYLEQVLQEECKKIEAENAAIVEPIIEATPQPEQAEPSELLEPSPTPAEIHEPEPEEKLPSESFPEEKVAPPISNAVDALSSATELLIPTLDQIAIEKERSQPEEKPSLLARLQTFLDNFSVKPRQKRKVLSMALSLVTVGAAAGAAFFGIPRLFASGGQVHAQELTPENTIPTPTTIATQPTPMETEVQPSAAPTLVATPSPTFTEPYLGSDLEIPTQTSSVFTEDSESADNFTKENPVATPISQTEQTLEVSPIPTLNLTEAWSSGTQELSLTQGEGQLTISLFLEKNTSFNYKKKSAPDGRSMLIWNASEAAYSFGSLTMSPGDTASFTQRVQFGHFMSEELAQNKTGKHGEGYIGNGEGACFAATVFGEIFGTTLVDNNGQEIPLFVTEKSAVQAHGADTYGYYRYLYHGPGVAINATPEGQLFFSVNPNLSADVRVTISMDITDTDINNPENGIFSPTVTVIVQGLSKEWKVMKITRLTADRSHVLTNISGRAW